MSNTIDFPFYVLYNFGILSGRGIVLICNYCINLERWLFIMKKMRKITSIIALVLVVVFFTNPATVHAAIPDPTYIYVDPDGGYKYFEFGYIPHYIDTGHTGAIENNENNTYWQVNQSGNLHVFANYAYPVSCRFTIIRTGPNSSLVFQEEISYADGHAVQLSNLTPGNYVIYVTPLYGDGAIILNYGVDTR